MVATYGDKVLPIVVATWGERVNVCRMMEFKVHQRYLFPNTIQLTAADPECLLVDGKHLIRGFF